ncbi:MAG: hypothetical protein COB59_12230 [Rhodospirillaceae bacterium]|nr:MAG: hypothetical protein COB59_12230 [Rhodospirillaceae bacterium]
MKLLTLHEVAETLAIHYETARRYCKSGELKYIQRPGCAIRVTDIELNRYIERHTICQENASLQGLSSDQTQLATTSRTARNVSQLAQRTRARQNNA